MDIAVVINSVLNSIEKFVGDPEKLQGISMDTSMEDLEINDIDFIKIILEIESDLDIELDDEGFDFKKLSTVKKITEYVYAFANRG